VAKLTETLPPDPTGAQPGQFLQLSVHRFDLSKNRLGSIPSSRPASVSRIPRPMRCSKGTPTSASSFARVWLTEGWA